MSYGAELKLKSDAVRDAFSRIGGLDVELKPIIGADSPDGYRNKAQYPVSKDGAVGFYRARTHEVIECEHCLLVRPEADAAAEALREYMQSCRVAGYDEKTGRGLVRHLYIRSNAAGESLICVLVNGDKLPKEDRLVTLLRDACPKCTGIVLGTNTKKGNVILGDRYRTLWGSDRLEDTLCGKTFRLSVPSFYQVNRVQAERLYAKAIEFAGLTGQETVLDLYCGAGTITLALSDHAKKVLGAEIVPEAIDDARENAARNGIANAEFHVGATEELLPKLVENGLRPDVIVLDPPRKGCDPAVLQAIIAAAPKRVVYVSCGAPTLARDAKLLAEGGYAAEKVQCVDMFCWTGAVETVMVMSQQKPDDIVKVGIDADKLAVTKTESKATYGEIQARVKKQTGLNVTPLYIAQVKRKHGIIERECYNKAKSESAKMLICPPDKEKAIEDALRFFGMIA